MFDRFTLPALQVLFHARSEVSQLGSSAIEPEHILLGVLDEGGGLGCEILARTGALDDVRSDIVGGSPAAGQARSPAKFRSALPATVRWRTRLKKPTGCCTPT